jgi:hypothetical protein
MENGVKMEWNNISRDIVGIKVKKQYYPVDYFMYNLETIQNLQADHSFFSNRSNIKGRSVPTFSQMFKTIQEIHFFVKSLIY